MLNFSLSIVRLFFAIRASVSWLLTCTGMKLMMLIFSPFSFFIVSFCLSLNMKSIFWCSGLFYAKFWIVLAKVITPDLGLSLSISMSYYASFLCLSSSGTKPKCWFLFSHSSSFFDSVSSGVGSSNSSSYSTYHIFRSISWNPGANGWIIFAGLACQANTDPLFDAISTVKCVLEWTVR